MSIARKMWRTLEPYHGMIYFAPPAIERYQQLGLSGRATYFAPRAAPMGAVPASVVIATFFNFNHELVRSVIPSAWHEATPESVLAARLRIADMGLRRMLGDAVESEEMAEAASLARRAAEVACERPEGRPLFAGHAALPWPEEPHLALWHGQSLLREFRGDGHIAALTMEGLTGLEALISHAASGDVPAAILKASRAWSDDEWQEGIERLAARGIVDADGAFTDTGRAQRQAIEDATDRLALAPYATLGDDAALTLRGTGRKLTQLVIDAGLLQVDPKRFLDPE